MKGTAHGRLEGIVLILIAVGGMACAVGVSYERLMHPSFRWVTIAGACLVAAMGLALVLRPRARPGASALLVFAAFLVVAVVGGPFGRDSAGPLGAGARPPPAPRDGYDVLAPQALFATVEGEAASVPEGRYAVSGLVYRAAELDREGTFVLLEPLMACCLADAVALGVRVRASGPLPEPESWTDVYGRLRRLDEPVAVPRFRLGAIVFTEVSRDYEITADELVPYRASLGDVVDRIPAEACGVFRDALERTGLAETLRAGDAHTVFAPLDLLFERMPASEREALFAPEARDRLRDLLMDFVVPGLFSEQALHERTRLEALSGRELRIEARDGRLRVAGARILVGDQEAHNGVIHVVHPGWLRR